MTQAIPKLDIPALSRSYGAWLCGLCWTAQSALAQDLILFSTEESFVATAGPHAGDIVGHGDELDSRGRVIGTNADLMNAFCPMPGTPNFGLDALHRRTDGPTLFSTELGWFDECRNQNISPGDLLAGDGTIVKTNAELIANFNPKPVAGNVGLDAVFELPNGRLYFSTELDLFDEVLGVLLRHGDLLTDEGAVLRTNQQLLANFCPMPVVGDLGLDAVHLTLNPADATVDGNRVVLTFDSPIVDHTCHLQLDCGASACVRSLRGDISRNGAVTTGDASILRFFFNADPAIVGAQYDFDTDGHITTGDFSQIRFFFNTTAPQCP